MHCVNTLKFATQKMTNQASHMMCLICSCWKNLCISTIPHRRTFYNIYGGIHIEISQPFSYKRRTNCDQMLLSFNLFAYLFYFPNLYINSVYYVSPCRTHRHINQQDASNQQHRTNKLNQLSDFCSFWHGSFSWDETVCFPPFRIHVLSIFAKAFTIKNLPVMDR